MTLDPLEAVDKETQGAAQQVHDDFLLRVDALVGGLDPCSHFLAANRHHGRDARTALQHVEELRRSFVLASIYCRLDGLTKRLIGVTLGPTRTVANGRMAILRFARSRVVSRRFAYFLWLVRIPLGTPVECIY